MRPAGISIIFTSVEKYGEKRRENREEKKEEEEEISPPPRHSPPLRWKKIICFED